eukprot:TRINITY_DN2298_c0_g2_i2.p1 TRINITY_DN2298_c0_g2~~TRINITY_DN2298_c0_g2_i2.p1  ORF type:complete len:867 (-),score=393.51 TRINITY_DN2298_c0_g2_i2:15-2615(-)
MTRIIKLSHKGRSSDDKFLMSVGKSGTLKDKIAAYTLNVSENPLFRIELVEKLLDTAKANHRRESSLGIEALKDLFVSNILPNRRLINFADRPLLDQKATNDDLFYWIFEDKVKKYYREFLNLVEKGSHDQINNHRQFMIKILLDLLLEKPEEEKRILVAIINKLGDKEKSVASKAVYSLNKIIEKYPLMRIHVVTEIQSFLQRPNVNLSSQYYSVIFLNEFVLADNQSQLAEKMIEVYFQLFDRLNAKERENNVEKKKEGKKFSKKKKKNVAVIVADDLKKSEENVENKMMTQILIGIRRAFPYANYRSNSEALKKHLDDLYRSCHSPSILRSIQAAQLIFLVESVSGTLSDRYYRMLYEKMMVTDLSHSHNWTQFLNLVYKSLKMDLESGRLQAFIKRLLQICLLEEPGFVCASLILISAIIKEKPNLKVMLTVAESSKRDSEEKYGEKEKKNVIKKEEDSDEETFKDVEEEDYEGVDIARVDVPQQDAKEVKVEKLNGKKTNVEYRYDPFKRDPQFNFANETCLWELIPFLQHFHPSVSKFAEKILISTPVEYKGDPFNDFNRNVFFDRFAYKNPKVSKKKHTSHMQKPEMASGRPQEPVNSASYVKRREENVPEDEKFLYEFFKNTEKKQKDKEAFDIDSDASDVDDDEFDRFMANGAGIGQEGTKKKKKKKSKGLEDPDVDDIGDLEEALRREIGVESLDDIEGETMKELEGMTPEQIEDYLKDLEQTRGNDGEFAGLSDDDEEEKEELSGEEDEDEDDDQLDVEMFNEDDEESGGSDDDGFLGAQEVDEDSEEDIQPVKGKKGKVTKSAFASADDYAHLLGDDVNPKQLEWEERKSGRGKKRAPLSRKPQKPQSKRGKRV